MVPGDLVLIDDHINAMFQGPLLRSESRISEMRFPYDLMLRRVVIGLAAKKNDHDFNQKYLNETHRL